MRFNILALFTLTLFLGACGSDKIARQRTALGDEKVTQDTVAPVEVDLKQFSDSQVEIYELIDNKSSASYSEALTRLEAVLFAESSKDPRVYVQADFVNHIELYVKLFQEWKAMESTTPFTEQFKTSLQKFKTQFFATCYDSNLKECNILRDVFKQVKATIAILLYYSELETDKKRELRWILMAYEIQARNPERTLDMKYVNLVLEMMQQPNLYTTSEGQAAFRQHVTNALNKARMMDWTETTATAVSIVALAEPWKIETSPSDGLGFLRKNLFKDLPRYYRADGGIKAKVDSYTAGLIDAESKDKPNLAEYPAYREVRLETLKTQGDELPVLLALGLYFGRVNETEAQDFTKNIATPDIFVDKLFAATRTIVRWDVAHISITSTKHLAKFFNSSQFKSKEFYQQTVDEGKRILTPWSRLHDTRIPRVANYLNTNARLSKTFKVADTHAFFDAVKRNILRTVAYPNMLALLYHLSEVEWKLTLKILWWTRDFDTTTVFADLFTGRFDVPWFNFTNLRATWDNSTDEAKEALFGAEVLDAVYYMFTTKTHLEYGIDADRFMKIFGDNFLKTHISRMEFITNSVRETYYSDAASFRTFHQWCKQVENNQPTLEELRFYRLSNQITPAVYILDVNNKMAKSSTSTISVNSSFDLLYQDSYVSKKSAGGKDTPETIQTGNDRYKLEIMPAINAFEQSMKIVRRLLTTEPTLFNGGKLEESEKILERVKRLQKAYWGSQLAVHKKMGDCLFTGLKESRRRAITVAQYEYKYLSEFVHPLMEKVRNGELSEAEANAAITSFHGFTQHRDWIKIIKPGQVRYNYSQLNFFFRVRDYLITGLKNPAGGLLMPAIVGSGLTIPVPPDYLTYTGSDYHYLGGHGKVPPQQFLDVTQGVTAAALAKLGTSYATDSLQINHPVLRRYSRWDYSDASVYTGYFSSRMEYQSQLHSLGKIEYANFDRDECRGHVDAINPDCYLVYESKLADVAHDSGEIFKSMELDPERLAFLDLINESTFEAIHYMTLTLKFSFAKNQQIQESGILPYRSAAGLFDYAYELFKTNYLGSSFATDYTNANAMQNVNTTCEALRENCPWQNERVQATQYYMARMKRPGFIYPYDTEILKESYNFIRDRARRKLEIPLEIEKTGADLMQAVRQGLPAEYLFHADKKAEVLLPLSLEFKTGQDDFNTFFIDTLGSFYLSDPDWSNFVNVK